MEYKIKILLISILVMWIGLSQKTKDIKISNINHTAIAVDPDIKQWQDEDKNIKKPVVISIINSKLIIQIYS